MKVLSHLDMIGTGGEQADYPIDIGVVFILGERLVVHANRVPLSDENIVDEWKEPVVEALANVHANILLVGR